eukprot:CAMPEP_0194223316 /NCGR_PEP_ID=MMETSP0156-20130528/34850_1 /TAXON_ID=33649 /ORGANISM="Thalassionema nitzschioides, Strain L26-B" /LENGTH=273 /DNA_ID=CAMNT_0038954407 /DNA_START=300 /DNA_END=1121 /DNA_ORIENTATION=-
MVTLIGTAHLSKASNEQVKSMIELNRPDVVMVELDTSRLERFGFKETGEDLGIPFSTADDIVPPLEEDDISAIAQKTLWYPIQALFLDAVSNFGRVLLTNMYNNLGKQMGEEMIGGGEFLAAINAAKEIPECKRIVLGDRNSIATLRRAAELALRSGDPVGVLGRLAQINEDEMSVLQKEVMERASEADSESDITVMLIEKLKSSTEVRTRIFSRLQEEVPEFSRSFLKERDYIMAESIRREGLKGARNICAVVGLAHVPGIAENLNSFWNDQ